MGQQFTLNAANQKPHPWNGPTLYTECCQPKTSSLQWAQQFTVNLLPAKTSSLQWAQQFTVNLLPAKNLILTMGSQFTLNAASQKPHPYNGLTVYTECCQLKTSSLQWANNLHWTLPAKNLILTMGQQFTLNAASQKPHPYNGPTIYTECCQPKTSSLQWAHNLHLTLPPKNLILAMGQQFTLNPLPAKNLILAMGQQFTRRPSSGVGHSVNRAGALCSRR